MTVLTSSNSILLWQDVVRDAEGYAAIHLGQELEAYLVWLLYRYTDRPEIVKRVIATAFLEAMQLSEYQRNVSLQEVGDQCLLMAGLFPRIHQRRLLKPSYFVEIGRAAYLGISNKTTSLYGSLALQFVMLMDVLQSIHQPPDLTPLEAYEQWSELGSQRALIILQSYTHKKD